MSVTSPLPRLDAVGRTPNAPAAVVLVLHGGRAHSREPGERKRLTYWRMRPIARLLSGARMLGGHMKPGHMKPGHMTLGHMTLGRPKLDGPAPAVFMLRYRYRGWNAPAKDAQRDAEWALDELGHRFPNVPVVLVGHSMGARAALGAAAASNVVAVCALAPWLEKSDPVSQLDGRTVLIAHGDRERWTDPQQSYAYGLRAKQRGVRICRFDVPGAGHFMIYRAGDWHALIRRFVFGVLGVEPMDPVIANALRQPTASGLRTVLTAVA